MAKSPNPQFSEGKPRKESLHGIVLTDVMPNDNIGRDQRAPASVPQNIPVKVWVTDEKGKCTYVNKNWQHYTGQPAHEALGDGWMNCLHPTDRKSVQHTLELAIKHHQEFDVEYRLRSVEGHYCWKSHQAVPKFSQKNIFEGFSGAIVDIEKNKRAQQELLQQKQLYHSIFQHTSDAVMILDEAGVILEANNAACNMHGYAYEELINSSVQTLIYSEELHKYPSAMEAMKAEKPHVTAGRHIKKSGDIIHVELTGSSYEFNGQMRVMLVIRDLTDQKKAQFILKSKEETLRMAIDATRLGTWDFNPVSGDIEWSDRCAELFGLQPSQPANYDLFLQCLHPEDRERTDALVRAALSGRGGGEYDTEYRSIGPDGSMLRWLRSTGRVFFNESGEGVRFIGTVQDITQQKLDRELLEEKSRELEFANEDLRNFTYTISHDIKNPLTSLMMAASMADDMNTIEELQSTMQIMGKSTRKISNIIEGLGEMIKEEETKSKFELISAEEIVKSILKEFSDRISEQDCSITFDLQVDRFVYIRSYLQCILRNLIDNALKYSVDGRRTVVHITAEVQGDRVEFMVKDNGIGIDLEEHSNSIFKPFWRVQEEKPGTGIGLYMIKRMIEKYHGKLNLMSEVGKGTTFIFNLPAQPVVLKSS
jgi:PAS domain S-box-containing protein